MVKNASMTQLQSQILSITFSHQLLRNTFNHFFTSIAETVQSKIKFSSKSFRTFFINKNNASFITTVANKEEIYKTISSLNIDKSCEPNSIPTKIYVLFKI